MTIKVFAMKTQIQSASNSNLARWLTDPRSAEFFGSSFQLKAAVLVCVIQGESLAGVARRHGVTRSAVSKHYRKAKSIWADVSKK